MSCAATPGQTQAGLTDTTGSDLVAFYRTCPEAKLAVPTVNRKATFTSSDLWGLLSFGQLQTSPAYRGVPRVGVWGDSHTATGDFMYAALQQWGFEKNTIRPGLMQPAMAIPGVRLPLKKSCATAGWRADYAQRAINSEAKLSKTLFLLSSDRQNEYLWFDFRDPNDETRLKWLNIHYTKNEHDRPLILGVTIDNGVEQIFNLSEKSDRYLQIKPATPFATVRIRLAVGQITIHGLEPIYTEAPKALLDIFSTPGATGRLWSDLDMTPLVTPAYDAVIFAYGTNDGMVAQFDEMSYAKGVRQALEKFRAVHPKAVCVVVGPPERGLASNAEMRPYTQIHQSINRIQSQVAKEQGCVAWDWQQALGGAGSANRLMNAVPPLLAKDQIHLTQEGYAWSGQAFAKAVHWQR